jgi:hypothetical protein
MMQKRLKELTIEVGTLEADTAVIVLRKCIVSKGFKSVI